MTKVNSEGRILVEAFDGREYFLKYLPTLKEFEAVNERIGNNNALASSFDKDQQKKGWANNNALITDLVLRCVEITQKEWHELADVERDLLFTQLQSMSGAQPQIAIHS